VIARWDMPVTSLSRLYSHLMKSCTPDLSLELPKSQQRGGVWYLSLQPFRRQLDFIKRSGRISARRRSI
jgi:hypothetical protein